MLSHATAEQALALIGVSTPTRGGAGNAAPTSAPAGTAETSTSSAAAAQASYGSSGPTVVDPLWGRAA